jgi:polygalacturonase
MIRPILILALTVCTFTSSQTVHSTATTVVAHEFDVKKFGANGDGKALDSPAINKAIDAAAAAGGGTVLFTAGTYRSFSIRLKRKAHCSTALTNVISATRTARSARQAASSLAPSQTAASKTSPSRTVSLITHAVSHSKRLTARCSKT